MTKMHKKHANQMTQFKKIVNHVQDTIKPVRWKVSEYPKKYGKRTAAEILESGETNYLNSCADLTVATIALLNERGFDPKMIVHEHQSEHTNMPALHFAVETPIDGKTHTLEYTTGRTVMLYPGRFHPKKSKPNTTNFNVHRMNAAKLDRNQSLMGFFGIKDYDEFDKVLKRVREPHLQEALKMVALADSEQLFKEVTKNKPEKL